MASLLTPNAGIFLANDSTPTSATLTAKACLIDADKTTACLAESNYASVGMDFGSPVSIASIRVYFTIPYTDYSGGWHPSLKTFAVYTSSDNSSWTLKQTFAGPTITVVSGSLAYVELTFSEAQEARYVKVRAADAWWYVATLSNAYNKITVTEMEAYDSSETVAVPAAEIHVTAHPVAIFPIFMESASIAISGHMPSCAIIMVLAAASITTSAKSPSAAVSLSPECAETVLSRSLPSYVWSIPARNRPAAQVIYTCTLTGDGESPAVPDLTLPMSSFQGRMRDGDPSYISAVIPNCMVYADDILARQNGDIVIKKGYRFQDGSTQLEEIARVDFESVRIDQGSKSASATISGHKTISSSSVKTITVEGVSYYCLQADGKRRVRALLDLFLRIGDTCIYGSGASDYMTVGYITYTVSVNQTIMEVTEA